jgi:hypothetical protein
MSGPVLSGPVLATVSTYPFPWPDAPGWIRTTDTRFRKEGKEIDKPQGKPGKKEDPGEGG